MAVVKIIQADVIEWAKTYQGEPAMAMLCDPPYHLGDNGFMNKQWDSAKYGVAFNPETWSLLAKHLYPGAFGMAFASSRGWHRLAAAIEDAGLIIHPTIYNWRTGVTYEMGGILGWVNGAGFPKATNISLQIDKAAGAERQVIGKASDGQGRMNMGNVDKGYRPNPYSEGTEYDITAPATDLAKVWEGHRYGRQALKPAVEPIIVFQKPYEGRALDNITQTGAGALNIADTRIPTNPAVDDPRLGGNGSWKTDKAAQNVYEGGYNGKDVSSSPEGRWPANFIATHAPDCHPGEKGEMICVPGCPIAALNQQGGMSKGNRASRGAGYDGSEVFFPGDPNYQSERGYNDAGGVARYFYQADWSLDVAEQIAMSDPAMYCAKASQKERNAGLDTRNPHTTVKPLALARWLATMLLPPDRYTPRRLLIPFAGVASECIGAMQAGWDEIIGIEREEEYVPIAKARIAYWTGLTAKKEVPNTDDGKQLPLF